TDFSRVEFQFQPSFVWLRLRLKLHAAEVGGILRTHRMTRVRLKLRLHAAEAGGILRTHRMILVRLKLKLHQKGHTPLRSRSMMGISTHLVARRRLQSRTAPTANQLTNNCKN